MSTTKLFTPLRVGNIEVAHRITLSPLTRFRAGDGHIALNMAIQYYEQRASIRGTLLISEAIVISPRAGIYSNVPGLWSPEQIAQWRKVTDAVHGKGSYIYAQLWAIGCVADIEATRQVAGVDAELMSSSEVEYHQGVIPREMAEEDIREVINDFSMAARNAMLAGFDGVEIHGANGYLVDQFLQNTINKRTDEWGGNIENRGRFPLEVASAIVDAIGVERPAIRYSPWSTYQSMVKGSDDERMEQFGC